MGISRDTFIFDIGTSYTRIAKTNCGILMREPTVAALTEKDGSKVLAAGKKAVLLYNKFPDGIVLKSPFKGDKLVDGSLLAILLKKLFEGSNERFKRGASRFGVVALRCGTGEMHRKQILDAVRFAISGNAKTVPSTVCGSYATDAFERSFKGGTVVMDIGVKRTTAAILCFGNVCAEKETAFGASDINIFIAKNGGGAGIESLKRCVKPITDMLEDMFIETSPELVGDIINLGITVTGGGAKIPFISETLSEIIGVDVYADEAAGDAVILGALKLNDKKRYTGNIKEKAVGI